LEAGGAAGSSDVLIDFFVQAPGLGGVERRAELVPIEVYFDEVPQTFNVGAASCGVPGTAAGLAHALGRFGTAPLEELVKPAIDLAFNGAPLNAQQAYIFHILTPILTLDEECRRLYAPAGRVLTEGETFRFPELADALERYGSEGPEPFCSGEVGAAVADHVAALGGTVSREDMAAYEAIERRPVRAQFRGTEVLTNPPPSSGGILIALCLELLERLGDAGVNATVAAMGAAPDSRGGRSLYPLARVVQVEWHRRSRGQRRRTGAAPGRGRHSAAGHGPLATTHVTRVDLTAERTSFI